MNSKKSIKNVSIKLNIVQIVLNNMYLKICISPFDHLSILPFFGWYLRFCHTYLLNSEILCLKLLKIFKKKIKVSGMNCTYSI